MKNSTLTPSQMYWRSNLRYLVVLLSIWFAVSFGASILFVEELNAFRVGGFKLGFWFAQQGSIYTFVVLIFVYIRLMNRLDAAYLNAAELSESGAEQKSTP